MSTPAENGYYDGPGQLKPSRSPVIPVGSEARDDQIRNGQTALIVARLRSQQRATASVAGLDTAAELIEHWFGQGTGHERVVPLEEFEARRAWAADAATQAERERWEKELREWIAKRRHGHAPTVAGGHPVPDYKWALDDLAAWLDEMTGAGK